ncbi:MAG TPA: rRNA maturation RNase YbeY [Terriglobales bacterium]|nr:rRNA maturation RNase YbeY [Terriglobales bacterium]
MVILNKRVAGVDENSLERFVTRARRVVGLRGSVTVLITSSREMRSLNGRFRGKDTATDVLSFPPQFESPRFAGDIAISAEIASENALQLGHSPAEEIKILVLHGVLHLAGYDHESDHGRMARLEERVRQKLGLPSALIHRTVGVSPERKTSSNPARSRKGRTR